MLESKSSALTSLAIPLHDRLSGVGAVRALDATSNESGGNDFIALQADDVLSLGLSMLSIEPVLL